MERADFDSMRRKHGPLWTMNDFYQFYPALKPDAIFNIHYNFVKHHDPSRWRGDWISEYNKSGAKEVFTTSRHPGLLNQVPYPFDFVQSQIGFGLFRLAQESSAGMMLALAASRGFGKVEMRGFHMLDSEERVQQLPCILALIDGLSPFLHIECPLIDSWRRAARGAHVDWDSLKSSVAPYWRRGV